MVNLLIWTIHKSGLSGRKERPLIYVIFHRNWPVYVKRASSTSCIMKRWHHHQFSLQYAGTFKHWPDTGPALARHWASIGPAVVQQHWADHGSIGFYFITIVSFNKSCLILYCFVWAQISWTLPTLLTIWWSSSPIAGPHAFCNSGNAPDTKHICHYMASMIGLPLFASGKAPL